MKVTRELLATILIGAATCCLLIQAQTNTARAKGLAINGEANRKLHPMPPGGRVEPLPDLLVNKIKVIGTSKLKVVVRNQGEAGAPQCVLNIKVYAGITSKLLYSTRLSVPPMPANKSKVLFFNTKGRSLDGNSIKAMVDATNVVQESDEENNEENLTAAP